MGEVLVSRQQLKEPSLKIGLVHNWPGKKNSELDLIVRIAEVLKEQGEHPAIIDPLGGILDSKGDSTQEIIDQETLDLVLNLHYTNPKWLCSISYVVNWNPYEFVVDDPFSGKPVSEPHLMYLMDCLRSHDRVLSAGSPIMDDYAAVVRADANTCITPGLLSPVLHTSMPASFVHGRIGWSSNVTAENFRVFYIGTNWEKTSRSRARRVRHKGLFEQLGESGRFRFFGLRKQNGVELWGGVKGYQGELPFDGGRSILKETARCGVSLVPSSTQHLRSGLVSTRIFQACAACSVVICDRNSFVERNFGDSVRYFDYGSSADETAVNIMREVEWIYSNWEESISMAEAAQRIFIEKFSLERELYDICNVARSDIRHRRLADEAGSSALVRVFLLYRSDEPGVLVECVDNLLCQQHKNLELSVFTTSQLKCTCEQLLKQRGSLKHTIVDFPDIDIRVGNVLNIAQSLPADFFIFYSKGFDWSPAHLTNLLRGCSQTKASVAYSPFFADFSEIRKSQDFLRYFIKGMDGGYDRLTDLALRAVDITRMPLGNILIGRSVLTDHPLAHLKMYDILAVFVLLKEAFSEINPYFSPVVTSTFNLTDGAALNLRYVEYDYLESPWSDGLQRDSRIYSSLSSGKSITPDLGQLSSKHLHQQFSLFAYLRERVSSLSLLKSIVDVLERILTRVR